MGTNRNAEEDRENKTPQTYPKSKYDEAYVAFGFTVTMVGNEERPACLLCLDMLAADSILRNILVSNS